MIKKGILILIPAFFLLYEGSAQMPSALSVIEDTIASGLKRYGVPSVSVAVMKNGAIVWAKAYGMADKTSGRSADTNTLYQVASMSKSVNAFCVMRLVQDQRLSLDTDIRSLLHSWKFPDNEFSKNIPITLRNLLSHTAGLGVHGFKGYLHTEKIPSIDAMLDGQPPSNSGKIEAIIKPGTKVEYSGGGTLIIKKILQDNIASNYDSLLEVMVLRPLGMMHSTFKQPLDKKYTNFAAAYDEFGKEVPGKYYIYPEQSPDGLWTTASDYARFVISIQRSLAGNPTALLNRQAATLMLTPVLDSAALGFFITGKEGQTYFGHSGGNIGFRCAYNGSFTGGTGVVVLTNSDRGGYLVGDIIKCVAAVYQWKGF